MDDRRGNDGDLVVLDFTTRGFARGGEAASRAQTEAGVGVADRRGCRHGNRQQVVAVDQCLSGRNLLASIVPVAVTIPVNPGIQKVAGDGGVLHDDAHGCGSTGFKVRQENDAVFVVCSAGRVVAAGGEVRLAVELDIASRAERRTSRKVECSAVGETGGITAGEAGLRRGRRIAEVGGDVGDGDREIGGGGQIAVAGLDRDRVVGSGVNQRAVGDCDHSAGRADREASSSVVRQAERDRASGRVR